MQMKSKLSFRKHFKKPTRTTGRRHTFIQTSQKTKISLVYMLLGHRKRKNTVLFKGTPSNVALKKVKRNL